jgi:hypothetical protein
MPARMARSLRKWVTCSKRSFKSMFWPVGSPAFPIWVLISLSFSQDDEMKRQKILLFQRSMS